MTRLNHFPADLDENLPGNHTFRAKLEDLPDRRLCALPRRL